MKPDIPDPSEFTTDCLLCAIGACTSSKNASDRWFAAACTAEIERRLAQPKPIVLAEVQTWCPTVGEAA